jgi:hypothetical protein
VGKGRIQPVESARRSVDILLALQESNRLAVSPDQTMIDSLAKLANQIRYKRFYDKRFKTIYQLEELDKAIQDLGLVDSLDIVYFANLNDIWNYAPAYRRGSGTRIEAGIIPDISYHYNKYDHEEMSRISTSHDNHYGIYGFFSINRLRPVNYTWQSDLMIDLTFGYMQGIYKYEEDDDNTYELKSENFNSLLNASWQFGYYPNTRTFAGLTPYVGVSNDQDFELDKNTFGVNTGLRFESYYYLSPRLRLSAWARISYYDNFANSMPTPFWNTVSYSQTVFNTYKQVTDAVAFPITALSDNKKKIEYSAFFSLTYAIF